jgi:mannitol-1-phosphate 5-dehydrogenase
MAFKGDRRLVGLGFGAIQAGLFAYEAQRSGVYAPPLVVDVRADLVAGLRAAHGTARVNIAHADRIDSVAVGPMTVADSTDAADRRVIVEALAVADEAATALPSVAFYRSEAPNSPHRLLAAGLLARTRSSPLVVFCAENHRHAAALLEAAVLEAVEPGKRDRVRGRARFIDTVIGKMSGVITEPMEVADRGLIPVVPGLPTAILVEAFDRILVSRVDPSGVLHPGMAVLREVDDLTPFEDAKLLGHNAIHALGAFLGQLLGLPRYADLEAVPGAMAFLRAAFLDESGATLICRYRGVDALFSRAGFAAFADDLLERMTNPYLADTIERAARDPVRKLGWDDRLVGLIRLGLAHDVPTPRIAMGVAAGIEAIRSHGASGSDEAVLLDLWPDGLAPAVVGPVLDVVAGGREALTRWAASGFEEVVPGG